MKRGITILLVLGLCLLPPALGAQTTLPNLKVGLALQNPNKLTYAPNEPIPMVVSLTNQSNAIITSLGFKKSPFHLYLNLIDPDQKVIIADKLKSDPVKNDPPDPPKTVYLNNPPRYLQGEPVETVDPGWTLQIPFNLRDHYALSKGGEYCVKALIPLKVFTQSIIQEGIDYGLEQDFLSNWPGVVESLPLCFTYWQPAAADLSLSMAGPATSPLGEVLTYELTITNNGPDTAKNVVVRDTLPALTTFSGIVPDYYPCAGTNPVECNTGDLLPGKTKTLTLQLAPTGSETLTLVNRVFVFSEATDSNLLDNSGTVSTVVSLGQPRIAGSIAGKEKIGEIYYIDLKLTNVGTGIAKNTLITGMVFRVITGTGTVSLISPPPTIFPVVIPHLGINQSAIIKFPLNVPAGVSKFSITEGIKTQDIIGKIYSSTAGQAVLIP